MLIKKVITHSSCKKIMPIAFQSYNYFLILLLLMFGFPSLAVANEIDVHLTNAISGEGLANKKITVYQQQSDDSLKWYLNKHTDAQGKIVVDLPGLGAGIKYQFITRPYSTGNVISGLVNNAGAFNFKVGRLEATIFRGASGKPMVNHMVSIRERLSEGKHKWVVGGLTDANGRVRFDIPGLDGDKKYVLAALNPFDGRTQYSDVISQNGKVTFTVGNQLLNVHLTNAINGTNLANKKVIIYQQQANGSLKWSENKTTDAQGKLTLELAGLGAGTQYKLMTRPYSTGSVYSDLIDSTGSYNFKVGRLEATIIKGASSKPMVNHMVSIRERLSDGKHKWVVGGLTNVNGVVRFDIPDLGGNKKYVLAALNPFDGRTRYSDVINQNGKVTFIVGNQLLNVHLTDAINGEALSHKKITVYQQQSNGSLKWVQEAFTDYLGETNFDLGGIGKGASYILLTKAYGVTVKSGSISEAGFFDFNVGKVQVRLSDADSKQRLINHRIHLFEKTSDGELLWQTSYSTDSLGQVHFDPVSLDDKIYIVRAYNLFGNKRPYYSPLITSSGIVDFSVSPNSSHSIDLDPPKIKHITPQDNSFVSDAGFEVNVLVEDSSEITSVDYKIIDTVKGISSGSAKLVSGQWEFMVAASMITNNKIVKALISVTDGANNITKAHRQFRVVGDVKSPVINITSHYHNNQVSENGFLLTGNVTDNIGIKEITATVKDSLLGLVVNKKPLEISQDNGKWALSVQGISRNKTIEVLVNAIDYAGNQVTKKLNLEVMTNGLNGRQLIDRLTFGATHELIEQIKTPLGAETFLQQQLHPELIDNSEFDDMLTTIGSIENTPSLQHYQLLHAIYSKHQLKEVMTWFWDNHFSTAIDKSQRAVRELAENNAFRQHALGNFRDLLQISATSPAMILYLDNQRNHKAEPNENYARELMELHTLGVDGGYSARDIAEVARVFTGWRASRDSFRFQPLIHDNNEKLVLGHIITADLGVEGGNKVLDILSTHKSTSLFICEKLLQVFVSDAPELSAINRCSNDFLRYAEYDDQITRVLENIFRSEYFSRSKNFHGKVKTPLEFVSGFFRQLPVKLSLNYTRIFLKSVGMNLFNNPKPTGWSEKSEDWVNSDQYFQYIQFIFSSVSNDKPREWLNYIENPNGFFKDNGFETAEGIVGYLFNLTSSNDYTRFEWNLAMDVLTEHGSKAFDINYEGNNPRLRKLLATVLSSPTYQLQ